MTGRERLAQLIAARGRSGAAYPALFFADKLALGDALAGTWLAEAWACRGEPATLALLLAVLEPAVAPTHLMLADLYLRRDDAHAEPRPELRAALPADLAAAYGDMLATLCDHFDRDSEYYATRRGFNYSLDLAKPLLAGDALACLARGALWYRGGTRGGELDDGELAEYRYLAYQALTPDELARLPCPAIVTKLSLGLDGKDRSADAVLPRCGELGWLNLTGDVTAIDGRALAGLPIHTLALRPRAAVLPAWLPALRELRALHLNFEQWDLPGAIGDATQVEVLSLAGVRAIPPAIGKLAHLRSLDISGWACQGLPEELADAPLELLRVTDRLTALPASFSRFTSLRDLSLTNLAVPAIPRVLFGMTWLASLHVAPSRGRFDRADRDELVRALPRTRVSIAYSNT